MSSSDHTLQPHSSRLDATPVLGDDQSISGLDDSDMLASLLATATVALATLRWHVPASVLLVLAEWELSTLRTPANVGFLLGEFVSKAQPR